MSNTLKIGRSPNNDIVLNFQQVSSEQSGSSKLDKVSTYTDSVHKRA